MAKVLVAYFSASSVTAALAKRLSDAVGADLHEIVPTVPYTKEDLDYRDPNSRSTVEMNDKGYRPAVKSKVEDMGSYDVLFVGFPIWWHIAPTIINTFLEQYDLAGKVIVPFATSGHDVMGETNAWLVHSCPGAALKEGRRFRAHAEDSELLAWAESFIK